MLTIDGVVYDVKVDVRRTAEMTASDISGLMMDKSYFNDVLGTYICTDVALTNNANSKKSFNQFDFELEKPNGVVSNTTFTGLDIKNLEIAELNPGAAYRVDWIRSPMPQDRVLLKIASSQGRLSKCRE